MITIAGQKLIDSHLYNINPLDYPVRTTVFLIPTLIFTWYSLQFIRNLEKGVTLALPKVGIPWLKIFSGKIKKTSQYRLQHYDNPYITGLLGLLFFTAAEFFLVIMFKTLDYTFFIN